MTFDSTRRDWILGSALAATSALVGTRNATADSKPRKPKFRFSLNTSTIREQKIGLPRTIDLAAAAGYDGVEPWVRELDEYLSTGGSLSDLRKRAEDANLAIIDLIDFCEWIVDDDTRRHKALEKTKRTMEMAQQLGCPRIAAPPVGATDRSDLDPRRVADRYRALIELGSRMDVVPQLELWGFSKTLGRLSDVAVAAIESDHPSACILADVYHLYRGGSGFRGIRSLSSPSLQIVHLNDYPADKPPNKIVDADRLYPGDGVAPLADLLRDLVAVGFDGMLSLELFNRTYWQQDPKQVATTGLAKMRAVVDRTFA